VQAAAVTSSLPLDERDQKLSFSIEGRPLPPSGQLLPAGYRSISEAYFTAMGIPLLRGRFFTPQDRAGNPPVGIIDETAARRYWPAGVEGAADPIGQKVRIGRTVVEVVGIVGSVRNGGLDKDPVPTVYLSYRQYPEYHVTLVLRHPHPQGMTAAVKGAVYAVDRQQPLFHIRTMAEVVSGSQSAARFTLATLAVFAAVAILLAAIGIYGVIYYSVAQRTHEMGVRMALGAAPADVMRQVMGEGLWLTAAGMVLGLAGSLALSHYLRTLVYGISPLDPVTYVVAMAVIPAAAIAGCWRPAARAARSSPMDAIRVE